MFALIDCNNFYASCEELFNPRLARKPLVILSSNDGCVIARSKRAKEAGIPMGIPAYQIKDQIERGDVAALSSNFTLYADLSQRVMSVLESFSPDMEIYSIDEAFFRLEPPYESQARDMRKKVKQWTGIPISIGIAPTKTLAKLANRLAKKNGNADGVFLLTEAKPIRKALEQADPIDIWGIGRALCETLKKKNIHTAAQLADQEDGWIRKLLGVGGYRTVLELRGTPCIELEAEEKRDSIICSRSFGHRVDSLSVLEEAVSTFTTRAAEKLREQGSRAGFLSVSIATSPFSGPYESRSCHIHLPNPTCYTPDLIHLAKEGLATIYRTGFQYKKAGVMLGEFSDEKSDQADLFASDPNREKKEAAMRLVDQINARYDKSAVRFLAEGMEATWKSAQSNRTPRFTTNWHELLKVR